MRDYSLQTLAYFAAMLLALVLCREAKSHDGYTQWMKPDKPLESCCNAVDCFPVQARFDEAKQRYVALIEGVWVVIPPEKILDPKKDENHNPDGSFHACWRQDGSREIFCFREAEPKF